jgi:hypothetical protein
MENANAASDRKTMMGNGFGFSIHSTGDVPFGQVELRHRGGTAETVCGYVTAAKSVSEAFAI